MLSRDDKNKVKIQKICKEQFRDVNPLHIIRNCTTGSAEKDIKNLCRKDPGLILSRRLMTARITSVTLKCREGKHLSKNAHKKLT